MYRATLRLAVLLAGILAAGCVPTTPLGDGADNANDNATGDNGGPPSDANTPDPVLAEIAAAFAGLSRTNPVDDGQALADALMARGAFASVDVGEGMVLATTLDGEEIAVFNDMPYEEWTASEEAATAKLLDAPEADAFTGKLSSARGTQDTHVMVVNTSPNNSIDGKLSKAGLDSVVAIAQKLGYSVNSPASASYESFKASFKNMDCLVWFGHAGNAKGRFFFEIPFFPEFNDKHADFGSAVIRGVHYDVVQGLKTYLAANDEFVKRSWSFKKGSLLIMSTCYGASDGAKAFRQACNGAGLEAFFGWTGTTKFQDMAETTSVLADLVMGGNMQYAAYHPGAGSEPSRAWSYLTALSDLRAVKRKNPGSIAANIAHFGYELSKSYSGALGDHESNLAYRRTGGADAGGPDLNSVWEPGTLALTVAESATAPSTLIIDGAFGAERGDVRVTINGTDLNITGWNPVEIKCQIPNDGANASGTVVVQRYGRTGNPVNLTLWKGPVTYSEKLDCDDPQKLTWHTQKSYSLDVQMRGDIHSHRASPGAAPTRSTLGLAALAGVSKVTAYSTSGTITEPHFDEHNQLASKTISTFSRAAAFTPPRAMSQIPGEAGFSASFHPDQQRFVVTQGSLNVVNGEHEVQEHQNPVLPSKTEFDQTFFLAFNTALNLQEATASLSLDSFSTGQVSLDRTINQTFQGNNGDSQGTVHAVLNAGPFTATNAPDASAPR